MRRLLTILVLCERTAVVHRGSAVARISSLGEVEEEEDGPSSRGNKAAIAEVPERHTGHGGRASITLHCTVKERERGERETGGGRERQGGRQGGDRVTGCLC